MAFRIRGVALAFSWLNIQCNLPQCLQQHNWKNVNQERHEIHSNGSQGTALRIRAMAPHPGSEKRNPHLITWL